jgi:glycopeptide antibiotics resistance protein
MWKETFRMLIDIETGIYASLTLYIFVLIIRCMKHKHLSRSLNKKHELLVFLAWVYFSGLTVLTLLPIQCPPAKLNIPISSMIQLNPLSALYPSRGFSLRNILGNIILFLPLIPILSIVRKRIFRLRNAILISLLFSCSIEFMQLLENISGFCSYYFRQVDSADVILNIIGGILGFSLYSLWKSKSEH